MDRGKKIVQISFVGIIVNLILVAFKAFVGVVSGSVAIIMDAVNNLSDAFSSVVTIVGTKLAGKKPDKKHPYGYGQIEYISSIIIAIIVIVAGFTSFLESFNKIIKPTTAVYTGVSLLIISVAFFIKLFLGRFVKKAGEKYNSEALVASGKDAFFDSIISLATLVAAAVSILFGISIEGYLGVVIAVVILKAGVEILLDSLSNIIGARIDADFSQEIKAYIREFEGVKGAYDLILHRYGPEKIIGSVHIEIPDHMTAREVHAITRTVADGVFEKFGIIITPGIYATNNTNPEVNVMKDFVNELIKPYDKIKNMHGFYVDFNRKLISFDIVFDFKENRKFEIRDSISENIKNKYDGYEVVINIDTDFSE